MRIAVTGATGNVGTSLLDRLATEDRVTSIVALARRHPDPKLDASPAKVTWISADVADDDLLPDLEGVDVLVHLAWLFQPTHRPVVTWQANAVGSARVFAAAGAAGVGAIVHASSVGAYSPGAARPRVGAALLDTTRARTELGWRPHHSGTDALRSALAGIAARSGGTTPPLAPDDAAHRLDELTTSVGEGT